MILKLQENEGSIGKMSNKEYKKQLILLNDEMASLGTEDLIRGVQTDWSMSFDDNENKV